jgi:hypothetical protein
MPKSRSMRGANAKKKGLLDCVKVITRRLLFSTEHDPSVMKKPEAYLMKAGAGMPSIRAL